MLLAVCLGGEAPAALATHNCDAAGSKKGPYDLLAYEALDWRKTYGDTFNLAGLNGLFPGDSSFGLQPVEKGPRTNRTVGDQRYAPAVILKGIGWIESGWAQAAFSVPYGSVGPVILSHSCAYGIVQIVSGMENTTGTPTPQQLMVGSHYAYNIAKGAQILVDKWNAAPTFRPIIGDGDPAILEDWYYAIWSYHGFSFVNHPLNPEYDMLRSPYSCDGTQSRSDYPYQELVYGCVSNPPKPLVGSERTPLWNAQPVSLPDLKSEQVYKAMSIDNFLFAVPKMDIPRPQPSHTDPTTATGDRSKIVGAPQLAVSQADIGFDLVKDDPGQAAGSVSVTIQNTGMGVMPWMATPSASWIGLDRWQNIALGSDLGSVTTQLEISVSSADLEPGTYEESIVIQAPYAIGSPLTITLRVKVFERSFVPGVSKSD